MNLHDMLEREKKKAQKAAEAKIQSKLHRQLRILNKEKSAFTANTNFERAKQSRAVRVLDDEKVFELENYLATKSPAIEARYKQDAGVVRSLVKTRAIVQELLTTEREEQLKLRHEIIKVEDAIVDEKMATTQQEIEYSKFRVPDQDKMDKRVLTASANYHTQRLKNMALQKEIDTAMNTRHCFQREEAKLNRQLDDLDQQVAKAMNEASNIFEERERVEGTRMKVKEHLARVKEGYERELLGITLQLSEDKKSEGFMRTKLRDNAQHLRDQKALEKERVDEMLQQKDEFAQAFDEIKAALGKNDVNEIVHEFLEQEETNFATFLTIGLKMESNEKLKADIHDVSVDNIHMEDTALHTIQSQGEEVKAIQDHTDALTKKIQDCNARRDEVAATITEFLHHLETTITLMQIKQETLDAVVGRDAVMSEKNALNYIQVIMQQVNAHIHDLTMIELTARATHKADASADERMLMRKPSLKIDPIVLPKLAPIPLKNDHPSAGFRRPDLMVPSDIRSAVLQDIQAQPAPTHSDRMSIPAPRGGSKAKVENAKKKAPRK